MAKKRYTITVSGKGGTGKTLISTTMIKLLSQSQGLRILAIDADPAVSLPSALGVKVGKTIGDIREEIFKDSTNPASMKVPLQVPLDMMIENLIGEIMVGAHGFHLLAMGRPEGPGCYCLLNDILRYAIDKFTKKFDVTVIDCEAGLEHLSRRTIRDMDFLFAVTDPTKRGINTAESIKKLAGDMELKFGASGIIVNKVTKGDEAFCREISSDVVGIIPLDESVAQYDRIGKPFLLLPDDSPVVVAVRGILERTVWSDERWNQH